MNSSCDRCRFFDRGFCKRFPPTFTSSRVQYPSVQSYDWCGEFSQDSAKLRPVVPQPAGVAIGGISEPQETMYQAAVRHYGKCSPEALHWKGMEGAA